MTQIYHAEASGRAGSRSASAVGNGARGSRRDAPEVEGRPAGAKLDARHARAAALASVAGGASSGMVSSPSSSFFAARGGRTGRRHGGVVVQARKGAPDANAVAVERVAERSRSSPMAATTPASTSSRRLVEWRRRRPVNEVRRSGVERGHRSTQQLALGGGVFLDPANPSVFSPEAELE